MRKTDGASSGFDGGSGAGDGKGADILSGGSEGGKGRGVAETWAVIVALKTDVRTFSGGFGGRGKGATTSSGGFGGGAGGDGGGDDAGS
jgi:hypothetical protein